MAVVHTERLLLDPLQPDDLQAFHRYRCLAEVARFQSFAPMDLGSSAKFLAGPWSWNEAGSWSQLAVRYRGHLVGDLGVHFLADGHQCEFGVTLDPRHQGLGFATEAVTAVIGLVFDGLGKHRVTASVDPRNTASMRLFQRLGFREEGHHIEAFLDRDGWADDVVFALLRREWQAG